MSSSDRMIDPSLSFGTKALRSATNHPGVPAARPSPLSIINPNKHKLKLPPLPPQVSARSKISPEFRLARLPVLSLSQKEVDGMGQREKVLTLGSDSEEEGTEQGTAPEARKVEVTEPRQDDQAQLEAVSQLPSRASTQR